MSDVTKVREEAVVRYKGKHVDIGGLSRDDIARLVYDLGIRQIELEIQNEQLRRSQAELTQSRDMYAELYDLAPVGYLTVGPTGLIDRANLTFCTMMGVDRRKLTGQPFSRFIALDDQDNWCACFTAFKGRMGATTCHSRQLRLQKPDGQTFLCQMTCLPVASQAGRLHHARITISDITELKAAQQAQAELVQRQNRNLQNILHAASHDLRSPLITIIGFTDELLKGCTRLHELLAPNIPEDLHAAAHRLLEEDIVESARFVKAAADKMDDLLKGLLDVSRLGAEPVEIQTLDMNTVIDEIVAACQFDIREKKAHVTHDDLPPCRGEPKHTSRVFANLIHNALKFLDPGRNGCIHVSAQQLAGKCIYKVEDNGVGIHPEDQQKIFDMFYKITPNGASDAPEGDGLGLTIAARILERQNGKIWVTSTPGQGSAFYVLLPAPQ
ncbi:MAG TPA: PAS domain-containing sensor histidine kinase [Anaerohalosphaeraceae bacterium]|nr:PAS domain-containing sensor histidine kinase [Anaerohalosphaeraceae bacterium]HRT49760.1 PAS domain-containing sensor histidine kinase [Anaerohalosphaeraceae bacterium]HRT85580.1 PAS domain-containing sensor histidine kinase [Anaerohalosphaeraceae bacterium]